MRVLRRILAISLSVALLASGTPAYALSRVQAVSFIDENTGYIGGWYPTQKGFISYTTDKGASWTATSTATSTNSYPISGIAAGPFGAWATAGEYSGKPLAITNPGLKWSLGGTIYSKAVPSQVIRLANGRLVAVGQLTDYNQVGTGWHGKVAFIATSDDQGASWTLRSAGPLYLPLGFDSYPPPTWASMADVDATADGAVLWAVGNEWNSDGSTRASYKRRLMYRSADGGSTWTTQTVGGTAAELTCLAVASATSAYAFGVPVDVDKKIGVKTVDGGSTWTPLATRPSMTTVGSNATIAAADAIDANTVVIAGNHPTVDAVQIARTTDGGATWGPAHPDLGFKLHDLEMITFSHGIAVGSNEAISHSTDGGVSWSYPPGEQAPWVYRSQPSANFSYFSGPVTVSGTANDGAGVGVERVEVRIRQADGRCWNGLSWSSSDAWIKASSSDGWKTWSYTWQPDVSLLADPSIVNVTARATDGIGLWREWASSVNSLSVIGSVLLASGASHTGNTQVLAEVSASAALAVQTRWRVGGGPDSSWLPLVNRAAEVTVTLPPGDGAKTVTFDFANAEGVVLASASDGIILDTTGPTASLASPSGGFDLETGSVLISGSSSDALSGVAAADVRIERSDGVYWDGTGWAGTETWLPAQSFGPGGAFTYEWTPDPDTLSFVHTVSVNARVRDAVGNTTATGAVESSAAKPTVSLAAGSSHTSQTVVPVTLSGPTAAFMRWSVAGGAWSEWLPYVTPWDVMIPPGDGPKTVTFDFAQDGAHVVAVSVSDGIVLDSSGPSVAVSVPSAAFSYLGGPIPISGTATDTLSGVTGVEVRIARSDGLYWNGSAWVGSETWLPAQTSDGWRRWAMTWVPDASVRASASIVSVSARATDGAGWSSQTTPVESSRLEATVELVSGAAITPVRTVVASLSAPGASHMRWRVDGGEPSAWELFAPSKPLELSAVEGTRAVSFDFAAGGDTSVVVVSASDDIVLDTSAPSVAIAAPTAGFEPVGSSVLITGVSSDAVSGVSHVDVRIARSDGRFWNGVGWTDQEHWGRAEPSGDGATWSLSWALDPTISGRVRTVKVTAKATDRAGHSATSTPLQSSAPRPSISVAGGATYASQALVPVTLSGPTADRVRWSVDGGAFSGWQDYSGAMNVTLPPGDGLKRVTAAFASDAVMTDMVSAYDDILLDTTPPQLAVVSPSDGHILARPEPVAITASASDAHSGVASVAFLVRRDDGRIWDGSSWGTSPMWTPLSSGGSGTWAGSWTPPLELLESGQDVTIEYRATDSLGLSRLETRQLSAPVERRPDIVISSPGSGYYITNSTVRTVTGWVSDALSGASTVDLSIKRSDGLYWSGGSWVAGERWIPVPYTTGSPTWTTTWRPDAALVNSGRAVEIRARARDAFGNERQSEAVTSSRRTKASLTRPTLSSSTIYRGRTYRATGTLKPRHTAGTRPVRVYAYRYVKGKYRYYKSFSAKASNLSSYTKYTASVKLPYRGKWRLRAVHTDTQHLKSLSSYRYVTVR